MKMDRFLPINRKRIVSIKTVILPRLAQDKIWGSSIEKPKKPEKTRKTGVLTCRYPNPTAAIPETTPFTTAYTALEVFSK
jgi:hypothetical protein